MGRNEIPTKVRTAVRNRSGGRCEFVAHPFDDGAPISGHDLRCRNVATEIHHRLSRRFKNHDPSVLIHLCAIHHRWVEENRAEALHRGLLITPPPYDPLDKFRPRPPFGEAA